MTNKVISHMRSWLGAECLNLAAVTTHSDIASDGAGRGGRAKGEEEKILAATVT